MRARGAQLTDIVVLVVAADDGLMPQTIEAINHAKAANVPIIVAINKLDLPEANPERVRRQLSGHDLLSEEWGGSTLFNEISALNGTGVQELLDNLLLQAELMDLKANYQARAVGRVVESAVDLGRGIVATVMIQKGTLRTATPSSAACSPARCGPCSPTAASALPKRLRHSRFRSWGLPGCRRPAIRSRPPRTKRPRVKWAPNARN